MAGPSDPQMDLITELISTFLNRIGRLVDTLKYWIPYSLPVDFFVYADGLCTNRVFRRSMYGWHFPLYTAISAITRVSIVFNVVVLAKVS